MTLATATEVQNNFEKYLKMVQEGEEIAIIKKGNEVARMISPSKAVSFLSDSLVGVISSDIDKIVREKRMIRHEGAD